MQKRRRCWYINRKVSIILVNWNAEKYLTNCLESLYSQDYRNIEVIMVDNASEDNSVTLVEKKFPKVEILRCKENLGYAGGNNEGIRKSSGNYILLLNTDTVVSKTAIGRMVNSFENDSALGIVGCKLVLPSGKLDHQGAAFFDPLKYICKMLRKQEEKPIKKNGLLYVDYVKGAALMARKTVLQHIGLLDKEYFTYFEDADLCKRARESGYEVACVVDDEIEHVMMGSSKPLRESTIIYRRNRMLYWLKNSSPYMFFAILPWDAGKLIKNLFSFLLSNDSMYWWEIEGTIYSYFYLVYRVFT